ncbi:MAG: hypothetical protein KDA58_15545, partial [Planctomycetaceae bacterium]|nr:hypothetical protein [Planctomycetaceae bacterium]
QSESTQGTIDISMNVDTSDPSQRILNTNEPILDFVLPNDVRTRVSYSLIGETLQLRYPAHSCSRSGLILRLRHVDGVAESAAVTN